MQYSHKQKCSTLANIEHGLRLELRAILRHYDGLRKPLDRFERHPHRSDSEPHFFVMFDMDDRLDIKGLQREMAFLVLPDERILESILQFAGSVWHLKDRLKQLAKEKDLPVNIESIVNKSVSLLICADLVNAKKHGRCENRSRLNPRLGLTRDEGNVTGVVQFDTSRNGVVELFYDGSTKKQELLVTKPEPIPFRVDVLVEDGTSSKDDAITQILDAFLQWCPIIKELGLLEADDPECKALRRRLDSNLALDAGACKNDRLSTFTRSEFQS